MALYHFSVKQVSRGKGQTVVNSAAYISGQKLYNDYYGQTPVVAVSAVVAEPE